jgi:thioredoxin 1
MGIPVSLCHKTTILAVVLSSTTCLVGCGTAVRPDFTLASNAFARGLPRVDRIPGDRSPEPAQATQPVELTVAPRMPGDHPMTRLPAVKPVSAVQRQSHEQALTYVNGDRIAPARAASHLPPRKVEHADSDDFALKVLLSDEPVLVDFYADWCGPCRRLTPVLNQIARETPNAKVVKVNIDDSPQLARRYGVSSIPNVMVFRDGAVVAQRTGLADRRSLEDMLSQ